MGWPSVRSVWPCRRRDAGPLIDRVQRDALLAAGEAAGGRGRRRPCPAHGGLRPAACPVMRCASSTTAGQRTAAASRRSPGVSRAVGDARLLPQRGGQRQPDPRRLARFGRPGLSRRRRHFHHRARQGHHHSRRAQSLSVRTGGGRRRHSRRTSRLRRGVRRRGGGPGHREAGGRRRKPRQTDAAARQELVRRINALTVDLLGTPPDDVVLAPPHAVLKTSSGKIRRAATREVYCGEGFAGAARAPWLQVMRLGLAGFWQGLRGCGAARCRTALRPVCLVRVWPAGLACGGGHTAAAGGGPALALCRRAGANLCVRLCGIRLRVEGLEHLAAGKTVFVANHASYVDGIVLAAALPLPVSFVAKQELESHPLAGPLAATTGRRLRRTLRRAAGRR